MCLAQMREGDKRGMFRREKRLQETGGSGGRPR